MIVGLTLTILGQTSNANRILDEFVAAEASHPKQSIEIRTSSTLTGHEVKITYDLSFLRPNRLRLEIKQPSSDRIFAIEGNRFTAYDPASNQFLTRNLAARGSLAERLSQAVGEVDEPLRIVLDESATKDFASRMKGATGWTNTGVPGKAYTTLRTKTPKGAVALNFGSNKMPETMYFESGGKYVHWLFKSKPMLRVSAFHPPAKARRVNAFYERAHPPAYADSATKHAMENAIHAYDQIKSLEYRMHSHSDTTHVLWQESSALQEDPIAKWSYERGVLSIHQNKTGKLFRGATQIRRLPDYLNALGDSIDPTLRLLLSGRNPIEVLFTPKMKAQTVAQASARGVMLQIVELSRPLLKIQLQFRSDQPLPVSIAVENLDIAGRLISHSDQTYEYISENKRFAAGTFTVGDAQARALPLPKLK